MIGDIARTSAYRKAILGNGAVAFQDKLVIDVGAGTDAPGSGRLLTKWLNYTRTLFLPGSGILSFFAAQVRCHR
jgi:histone-arginine methyltransferase CARM1